MLYSLISKIDFQSLHHKVILFSMLQNTFFAKKSIHAKICIPGSKSITNRALLCAALAEGISEIRDILISTDTLTFIHALKQLGVSLNLNETTNESGAQLSRIIPRHLGTWASSRCRGPSLDWILCSIISFSGM